jgi:hypothetical protein
MRNSSLHVGYLVTGLVFMGIATSWALVDSGTIPTDSLRFVLPLVLVVAGSIGLVAMAARGLTRGHTSTEPTDPTTPYTPDTDTPETTDTARLDLDPTNTGDQP